MIVTEDGPVQSKCPEVALSLEAFLKGPQTGDTVRETAPAYRVRRKKQDKDA